MDTKVVPLTNKPLTASAAHSQTSRLEEASRSLRSRIILDRLRLPMMYEAGKSPSGEEMTAVLETIRSVRSGLSVPAATSDVEKCVRLLIGGLKMQAGLDEEAVAEAFSMALEDAKGPVLKLAVKNLIQGKAPDRFSKTFLPSAPELSSYCRELEKYLSMLCDATSGLLCLREAPTPQPEKTEAEREEMRRAVAQAAQNISANVIQ